MVTIINLNRSTYITDPLTGRYKKVSGHPYPGPVYKGAQIETVWNERIQQVNMI